MSESIIEVVSIKAVYVVDGVQVTSTDKEGMSFLLKRELNKQLNEESKNGYKEQLKQGNLKPEKAGNNSELPEWAIKLQQKGYVVTDDNEKSDKRKTNYLVKLKDNKAFNRAETATFETLMNELSLATNYKTRETKVIDDQEFEYVVAWSVRKTWARR